MFYLSMTFESWMIYVQLRKKWHRRVRTSAIAERYGAFTLIIL